MNTKTTKFLAVMAVLAFAFAAFAVAVPAQDNDAALPDVTWNGESGKITGTTAQILEGVTSITDSEKIYYYLEDASVSIPSGKTGLVFFVKVGATVTISASGAAPYADSVVAVVPVSSVTVNNGTVTVQQAASANYLTAPPSTTWTGEQHNTIYTLLAIHVNEIYKLKASSNGMIVQQGDNDGDYYGASFTLEGTFSKKVNLKGATQNVTYINFTGTITNDTTSLVLTKFTGEIDKAGNDFSIIEWDAGDVEVLKAAQNNVLLKSNIFEGCTLYVDGGQFAETDGTSYYNGSADPTTKFVNNGTISIKQGKTTATPPETNYGNFTLADADMQNKGTITNLGAFYSTQKIENTGKIVTGHSEAATATLTTNVGFTTGEITNNGTFTFKETTIASTLVFSKNSTGDIRNQVTSNKNIDGEITTDTYGFDQSATIIGNSTLTGVLTLNGVLIIEEGVTLTITDAGSIVMGNPQSVIVNNGTIEVQNAVASGTIQNTKGFITNNGSIILSDPATSVTNPTVTIGGNGAVTAAFLKNYGTVTNSTGKMDFKATGVLLNMTGASFVNEGELATANGTTVKNGGYIGINGKVTATGATLTITETDKSAVFEVIEMKLATNKITVTNGVGSKVGSIEFPVTGEGTYIITGLKVSTYNVPNEETGKADYGYFILSGNASYFTANYSIPESAVTYIVKMIGAEAFIGDLVLNEQVRISGDSSNHLYFVGTAMMVDSGAATIGETPEITVNGKVITSRAPLSGYGAGKLNAAMYTVTNDSYVKTYYYTTLANAISEAAAIGADKGEVTATGATKIAEDLTIPAPIKLKNQGTITIDDGADVTIEDGASINNSGTITVNGSLCAAVAKTGLTGSTTDASIISDVKVVGNPDVMYTNLYNALAVAEAGDEVVITKNDGNPVVLTKDTTIPYGVTLDTNEKVLLTYKAATATTETHYKLIVDGTLELYAAADFKAYDDVTLNGYIVSDDKRTYSTTQLTGAYFETEVANVDYYYIAGIKNLGTITATGITEVEVYGDISLPTLEFGGIEDMATVTFNGNVEVLTISAHNAKVVFAAGDVLNTKITDGTDTVTIKADVAAAKKFTVTIGDDFGFNGDLTTGTTLAKNFTLASSGEAVIGELNTYNLKIDGIAKTEKTVVIDNALTVTGTLDVAEKGNVRAKYANVTGNVDVDGKATITNVTIGSSSKAIAAAASVTGEVTATAVILYAGNTVDPAIVEDMKYNNFYIDGKLWFTVYSNGNVVLAKTLVPVENAIVNYNWSKGNVSIIGEGDDIGKITGNVTPDNDATKYDISVKYDIYNVTIKTDAGVKAVYIDGQVMISPEAGRNGFTLLNLEAGTYKVTYTLINGYEGTAQLYTADGTILKDNSFVLSGTTDTNVLLQLSGTEQIVTPEPSPVEQNEWTITTILLVILVILIAVMAVIVALRLNRS